MAKVKTVFVCNNCGFESSKWLGKCPSCNEWNTFYEESMKNIKAVNANTKLTIAKPVKLNEVEGKESFRFDAGYQEVNRVLGGGLVKGSLVLIGGEPGIGKSTLVLQICDKIANEDGKVLYVSGEESVEQVKMRADRLQIHNDNLMFLGETDMDNIEKEIEDMNPKLVVIDSIQTMFSPEITSPPGTVSQVREITARIMRCCKQNAVTTILIGHVTKEGNIAGPRVLEHMVDTVLYIEGERFFSYRIVRSVKNRFGSTNEIGMFEMDNEGMVEVKNPSSLLISETDEKHSGSVLVCSVEGTRPLLVEIQALTTPSVYGLPKRTANGFDYNRQALLIAVLEKCARINLGNQDVYLNIASGMKLAEPAVDLGVAIVMVSSFKDIYIPKDVCFIGELGLTGEVRSVNLIDKRLNEIERLGIKKVIIPYNNKKMLKNKYDLNIIGVKNINEALSAIMNNKFN